MEHGMEHKIFQDTSSFHTSNVTGWPQFERSAGCLGLALRCPVTQLETHGNGTVKRIVSRMLPIRRQSKRRHKEPRLLILPCFSLNIFGRFGHVSAKFGFGCKQQGHGSHFLRKTREAHPVVPTRPWKDIRAEICNKFAIFCCTIELKTWKDSQKYSTCKELKHWRILNYQKKAKIEETQERGSQTPTWSNMKSHTEAFDT